MPTGPKTTLQNKGKPGQGFSPPGKKKKRKKKKKKEGWKLLVVVVARRVYLAFGFFFQGGKGECRVESDRNLNPSYLFPASLPNPLVLCLIGEVYFGFKYFRLLSHFFFAFDVISCQLGGFCIVCSEFCPNRRSRTAAGFSCPMWSSVSLGFDWCASMVLGLPVQSFI